MDPVDRRKFLKQAGVATAAGSAAVVMPASFASFLGGEAGAAPLAKHDTAAVPAGADLSQPVVAYLRDLKTGEISIFKGDQHVSVKDKALAARLFNAAG